MNEREIFDAALAIADPIGRSGFLDRACVNNQPLRDHLCGLLDAHDKLGGFLQRPLPVGDVTMPQTAAQRAGAVVAGRYKLLEQIGEGGMGAVWVAEQTDPVKRRVALKLIKPGMDTCQVLSRFEAERQALALMDHPNIARVFDGGMTDEGRPFFVMEYVKGLPLTQYCDDTRLTVADRLALFIQVCQAVQHAHQKGIIHRDLKPSNILVCLYDGQPVPKVIDFGLAKAMHQSLTEHTLYTAHGLMVGTPLYMSPEQAEFNNLDIDTRSDIYSLGVILYELLTGTTPLGTRQFKDAAWQEMVRLIKEDEPPRPSVRLSGSGSLPALAAQRRLEPAKLARTVRGELDWIVMKALEKDRSRRYETANGLGRDVQRYLADESVEACPPSASYQLRTFARRNVRALSTAALVGTTLLVAVGAVAGSLGWLARDQQARQAKLAGQLELILEEVTRRETEQKWPEALAAAQRAEALLAGGGGNEKLEGELRELLTDLALIERLESIRLETIGIQGGTEWADGSYANAFREIGVDPDVLTADEAAQRLLSRTHAAPIWGVTLDDWSRRRYLTGNAAGARVLAAVARRVDADPWRQQLRDLLGGIDESDFSSPLFRAVTMDPRTVAALEELATSPELHRQPPASLFYLGLTLTEMARKPEQGVAALRIAHERYPGDFWINTALAQSLASMGSDHQDEALGFNWAALALRPTDAFAWYRIGVIRQYHHKDLDKANACYRKALQLGQNHAWVQTGIGRALLHQNKLLDALACLHKAIELEPSFAPAQDCLGDVLRAQKRLDEAVVTYRKAIEINPKHSSSYYGLGLILLEQNKLDEAVAVAREGVALNSTNADFWWVLGRALHKQKKLDEAIAAFYKALELNPKPAHFHWGLGFALRDQKNIDEAVVAFRTAVALDPTHSYTAYGLGLALMETKQSDEAIAVFRKALELDPTRADAHQKLGALLADRGNVSEAIPCFRKAVALAPKSAWNHASLSWHLATAADRTLRDPRAAVIHARQAVELAPATAIHWRNLGAALREVGEPKEAVQAFEKVDELSRGSNHDHRFFLAMAYWQLGEGEKARQTFTQGAEWMDQNQPDNEAQRRFRTEAAELLRIAEPSSARPQ